MEWNDWLIACWIIATLMPLLRRQWLEAVWAACFAVFLILDRVAPAALPSQLKYPFLVVGLALLAFQILREYDQYKKKLAER